MSQQTKRFYEFDRFRIDVTERVLICEGELLPLTQKAFEVLVALVERRGGIVSKEELLEKVWPDTFVEESNLAQNIYTLRKALGQTPDGEGYIATVPRRGYRFAANVRELVGEEKPPGEPESIKLEANVGATSAATVTTSPDADPLNHQPDQSPDSGNSPTVSDSAPAATQTPSPTVGLPPRAFKILSAAALLVALASIAWFISHRNRGNALSSNMTITAFTTAGNVLTAAISPDGAYVAYATSENADQSALWIEQLSTSTRRAIIPAAECRYYALTFSPDGGHLYYVAATKEFPPRSVYRVSVLGGQSKRLVEHINAAVSFSPDGSKIALRRAVDIRRASILSVADADGRNEKEIASVRYLEAFYDPAWSPDGKMIASAVGNPNGVAEMYVAGVSVGDGAMKTIS
jgi:DNA-binding winged helix-turn-helix (wHTH) protein/dipeptidyl aminopeptidase/acylaminoacyl peptidase